jgi:hypothetical protein
MWVLYRGPQGTKAASTQPEPIGEVSHGQYKQAPQDGDT